MTTARELSGRQLAAQIRADAAADAARLAADGRPPRLAVVTATADEASAAYVRSIATAAEKAGIACDVLRTGTAAGVTATLAQLADDPEVDGVILQTPLPGGSRLADLAGTIPPGKDIDGANPSSLGRLAAGLPAFAPATAQAVIALLRHYEVPLAGRHAVIVGRSVVVGKPAAHLLLDENATVTVCHSRTADLPAITRQADVLVAAAGRAGLIRAEHVSPGTIVIDVGTNAVSGGIVGDVSQEVAAVVAGLTPVPGGVGPVTTALLLQHVTQAATARFALFERVADYYGCVRRSYKFLLRPTSKQEAALSACLEDTRQLYNAALEERRDAWTKGRHRVTFYSQDAQLKEIRGADPERYGRWSFTCERAAIRRLDRAFQAFFRRCAAGEKPGYPRFKGSGWWDTVEWPQNGGARWDSVPHPTVTRVHFKGVGHVRVHQHRTVRGRVKTITAKRECGRWYVILSCDDVPAEPLEPSGAAIGIDLGIASFLTTSDGTQVPNPRHLGAAARRLTAAQRELARKKRGSNRRREAVTKVARLHAKVRRQRLDHTHKLALTLVRKYDLIVHEKLQIGNMTARPKPRRDDASGHQPNGAAAKAGLNKSILDAGWGIFLRILAAKAESAGRVVIAVDPRHTSQRCAQCGHVAAGNRVSQAEFNCLACRHHANADVNAAINVLRAGLALREANDAARKAAPS